MYFKQKETCGDYIGKQKDERYKVNILDLTGIMMKSKENMNYEKQWV